MTPPNPGASAPILSSHEEINALKRDNQKKDAHISALRNNVLRLKEAISAPLPMRRNMGFNGRDIANAGDSEENITLLVTHPLMATMANTRARMNRAREWVIMDGDPVQRAIVQGIFERSCINNNNFSLLRESLFFGKGVTANCRLITWSDEYGRVEKDSNGIVKIGISDDPDMWYLEPVSAQVVKEVRTDFGPIAFLHYIRSSGQIVDSSVMPEDIVDDDVSFFYLEKLAGREFGTSYANIVSYPIDQYNRADFTRGIIADKYSTGMWVFTADTQWMSAASVGQKYMDQMEAKYNEWLPGSDIFLQPGFGIESKTMDISGLNSVLAQIKAVFEECSYAFGLCPKTFYGDRDIRSPFELDTMNSDSRALEEFYNTQVIPKILRAAGFDGRGVLPKFKFIEDAQTLNLLSKSYLMLYSFIPQIAPLIARKLGIDFDPSVQTKVKQAETGPANQVESKPGKGMHEAINYTGQKKPEDDAQKNSLKMDDESDVNAIKGLAHLLDIPETLARSMLKNEDPRFARTLRMVGEYTRSELEA